MWAMQMGHIDVGADQNASNFKKKFKTEKIPRRHFHGASSVF